MHPRGATLAWSRTPLPLWGIIVLPHSNPIWRPTRPKAVREAPESHRACTRDPPIPTGRYHRVYSSEGRTIVLPSVFPGADSVNASGASLFAAASRLCVEMTGALSSRSACRFPNTRGHRLLYSLASYTHSNVHTSWSQAGCLCSWHLPVKATVRFRRSS